MTGAQLAAIQPWEWITVSEPVHCPNCGDVYSFERWYDQWDDPIEGLHPTGDFCLMCGEKIR